jgi:hypothetical protein
MEGIDMVEEQD